MDDGRAGRQTRGTSDGADDELEGARGLEAGAPGGLGWGGGGGRKGVRTKKPGEGQNWVRKWARQQRMGGSG